MDGSLSTPFMQYPELSTSFELACMTHCDGLDSRASFEELTASCAAEISASARSGRQVLLVGESFGATLAIAVAHRLRDVQEVRGLVLVNPATSYERSALARFGPICAALQGPLLYPLYLLSLIGFAALVLTPVYQAPAFISMLAATKVPTLLNNPYREAWLGRVALAAFLGVRAPGLDIGPLLAITPFKPQDL
jgi:pimeloyl-ACP methyl ester carboxylesterase